jgi:hypothetical protein
MIEVYQIFSGKKLTFFIIFERKDIFRGMSLGSEISEKAKNCRKLL